MCKLIRLSLPTLSLLLPFTFGIKLSIDILSTTSSSIMFFSFALSIGKEETERKSKHTPTHRYDEGHRIPLLL